jgi:hypothetical protein
MVLQTLLLRRNSHEFGRAVALAYGGRVVRTYPITLPHGVIDRLGAMRRWSESYRADRR